MKTITCSAMILALGAAGASAQTISGGPISGSVFDPVTHSIRSIVGMPGAAYLGGSSARTWDMASTSPDGKKALALAGTTLNFIPDLSQPDAALPLGSAIETVDRIVWSADSGTAALYSSRSGQLQRITGLGGAPAIQAPVDLTSGGPVSGWALSPNGASIAYSIPASAGAGVYLLSGSAAPLQLGGTADPGALSFSADAASLFVFDRAKDQIVKIQVASGATVDSFQATPASAALRPAVVASAKAGVRAMRRNRSESVPAVVDLAATADGSTLLAAKNGALCVYDLARQNPDRCQTLDMNPASIQAVSQEIFVLNYPRTGALPLWLWDGNARSIYFVPSGRTAASGAN